MVNSLDQGSRCGGSEKLLDFKYMMKMEVTVFVKWPEVGYIRKVESKITPSILAWAKNEWPL